jgi:excinuclease ABC subunit B
MVADDPLARQSDIERDAGAFGGEAKYGRAGNQPPKAGSRIRKPTDADMGPHNFGGGEGLPAGDTVARRERPDPGTKGWKRGGRRK